MLRIRRPQNQGAAKDPCSQQKQENAAPDKQRIIPMVVLCPNIKDNKNLYQYTPFDEKSLCQIIQEARSLSLTRSQRSARQAFYDSHYLYPYYVASPQGKITEPVKQYLINNVMRVLTDCRVFEDKQNPLAAENAKTAIDFLKAKSKTKIVLSLTEKDKPDQRVFEDKTLLVDPIWNDGVLENYLLHDLLNPDIVDLNNCYPTDRGS